MLVAEFKTRRLLNLTIFLGTNDEDAKVVKELLTSIGLSEQILEYQQVQIIIFQRLVPLNLFGIAQQQGTLVPQIIVQME